MKYTSLNYCGRNFVVFPYENGKTRDELVKILKDSYRYSKLRQPKRLAEDVKNIKNLPGGKYYFEFRQYTGHDIIPKRILSMGKLREITYISKTIWWRRVII